MEFDIMYFITVIFFIAIVLTIIVYTRKTAITERYTFSSLSTLLQTLFVFVTLWITIYTIRSSNNDSKKLFENLENFSSQLFKMDTSLTNVSEKLSKLPKQLDEFSESINALNTLQSKQTEDFKENTQLLNETIISLHNTVKDYESNIVNYSTQLNSIVKQTDQQLNIWKEQQRVLLDEFSRKPKLKIEVKNYTVKGDTTFIDDLVLSNNGNIESSITDIFIRIPSGILVSVKSEFFKKLKTRENLDIYNFETEGTNVSLLTAGKPINLTIAMKLFNNKGVPIIIGYQINYYSKYDSGVKNDVIIMPKTEK